MTQRANSSDGEDIATKAARAFRCPSPDEDTLDSLFSSPATPLPLKYSPRPLVNKRVAQAKSSDDSSDYDFLAALKLSMQQEQMRAEQVRLQYGREQQAAFARWELERKEDREWREEDRKERTEP